MPLLRASSNLHELLHHQEEVIAATHHDKPRQRITSLHSSNNLHVEAKPAPPTKAPMPPPEPPSLEPVAISREWVDDQIARRISEPVLLALEKLLDRQEARFGNTMFLEMTDNDRSEIERLMTLNYQFEEAALVKFNRLRGLVIPPPGELLQRMSHKSPRHGLRRVDSMAADRLTSASNATPISAAQQRLHQRHMQCLVNLSEPEQIRLSLLLSKQEQQHGLNMFEAMTEADEREIDTQLQRGYRYEDVAYHLFQLKYAAGLEMPSFTQALSSADHIAVSPRCMPVRQLSRVNNAALSTMNRSGQSFFGDMHNGHSAQQDEQHALAGLLAPMIRSGESFYGDLQHAHSVHHQQAQQEHVEVASRPVLSRSNSTVINSGSVSDDHRHPAPLYRSSSSYNRNVVSMRPAPMTRSGQSFYGDLQHGHSAAHAEPPSVAEEAQQHSIVLSHSPSSYGSLSIASSSNDDNRRHCPAPENRSSESFYGDLEHGYSAHDLQQADELQQQQPQQRLSRPLVIITRSLRSMIIPAEEKEPQSQLQQQQRVVVVLKKKISYSSTAGNGLPPTPRSIAAANRSHSSDDFAQHQQQDQQHQRIVSGGGIASPRSAAIAVLLVGDEQEQQ